MKLQRHIGTCAVIAYYCRFLLICSGHETISPDRPLRLGS